MWVAWLTAAGPGALGGGGGKEGLGGRAQTRHHFHPRPSPEGARRTSAVDHQARIVAIRTLARDGHPTHPTWYHDSQIADSGGRVTVVWNGPASAQAAQLDGGAVVDRKQLGHERLVPTRDSTGRDRTRHDVPALFADGRGRLHVLYGGGSLSRPGASGPDHRQGAAPGRLEPLTAPRRLHLGGGSAYDFEAVRDRRGVVHLVGQRGRIETGSLVDLRWEPDGRFIGSRELVRGGQQRTACVLGGRPRGCLRFAIARIAADPGGNRLHLVWGYSEASLWGKCHTDAGYCDHDLYYAVSADGGRTWRNAASPASVAAARAPIANDDRRFRVVRGHVGLFKALAVGRAGVVIAYTVVRDGLAGLRALHLDGRRADDALIAPAGQGAASWRGSLVLAAGPGGYALWVPTGNRIFRFASRDGRSWGADLVYRGPAWSLTGAPSADPGREWLVWRGAVDNGRSDVMLGSAPVP